MAPCLFNLQAEYIMWNARLDETQARIKIAGRNNLIYADNTTLMAESEELKSLLIRVKEESESAGLKINIKVVSSAYLRLILFYEILIPAWYSSSQTFCIMHSA